MGYRSNVMCVMYASKPDGECDEAGMAFIKAWLKSHIAEEDKELFEFNDDMVVFSVEDWKWYESYPNIQRLDKLFEDFMELCDEGSNYRMEFMRVGESYDDVEVRESDTSQGWLRLSRSVYIDGR
jgi:hypothetical protein